MFKTSSLPPVFINILPLTVFPDLCMRVQLAQLSPLPSGVLCAHAAYIAPHLFLLCCQPAAQLISLYQ
jgi:hypothetical protein